MKDAVDHTFSPNPSKHNLHVSVRIYFIVISFFISASNLFHRTRQWIKTIVVKKLTVAIFLLQCFNHAILSALYTLKHIAMHASTLWFHEICNSFSSPLTNSSQFVMWCQRWNACFEMFNYFSASVLLSLTH